jgi:hypothetical protein
MGATQAFDDIGEECIPPGERRERVRSSDSRMPTVAAE